MTKTEQLKATIQSIIKKRKKLDFEEYCVGFDDYKIGDELLKAFKGAGLRFVPDFFDNVTFQSGHHEGIMKAIAQIEDIEL